MNKNKKNIYIILILIAIFALTLYIAAFAGYKDCGFHLLKKTFSLNGDSDSILLQVLRFPRVIKAVIAGSCLALSGMFMQSVSKNPLAEPYITGISSGAGLGIIISVLLFNGINYSCCGFAGALISAFTIICICGLNSLSISKLILIGLSVNMFVGSIISFIVMTNSDKAYSMMFLLSGGISESFDIDFSVIMLFFISIIASMFLVPKLNFLILDENFNANSQLNNITVKFAMVLLSALLASVSVLTAGILGFVGIIAPLISKMLLGNDYRWLFFSNIIIGSVLILFSDFLSRLVAYPLQVPLGVVVSMVGAPIFIYFIVKKGGFLHD